MECKAKCWLGECIEFCSDLARESQNRSNYNPKVAIIIFDFFSKDNRGKNIDDDLHDIIYNIENRGIWEDDS